MSRKELLKLQANIEKAMAKAEAEARAKALAAVQAKAKEMGYSVSELYGDKRRKRTPSKPKYRHPENSEVTWSGRGRQPQWVKEAAARGNLEALRIKT
jgi:DNA-binding protein H-NS